MHVVKRAARLILATSACAASVALPAAETTSYTYDALGRLVATGSSGTANDGVSTAVGYDPAGNRYGYAVGTGGAPPQLPTAPAPAPPPPSGNQPPTTAPDTLTVQKCGYGSKNVVANDTDPEGNTPLALVAVGAAAKGTAGIVGTTTIEYQSSGPTGTDTVSYTVRDSLGATATGTLTVTITTTGSCL